MSDIPLDSASKSEAPKRPSTSQRKKARVLVLQALYQWQLAKADISQIEAEFRVDNDFAKIDEDYFVSVFREIPKVLDELDAEFESMLDRPKSELDPIELSVLRMGTYEFKFRIDVPYRVVVNEAIELAKKFGGTDGHKYVNSILDKLAPRLRPIETKR